MSDRFVPADFVAPRSFAGPGFRLEPLGPEHNERDHAAWMSSIEHIHTTPGFDDRDWPEPMTMTENLADLERHFAEFEEASGFTYSILDGDAVIGCVYIYPPKVNDADADVASWVRESRSEMDGIVWRSLSAWLVGDSWPFTTIRYAARTEPGG